MEDVTAYEEDVVKSLFTDKYSKEDSMNVLAKLESTKQLALLIKEHHIKYFIDTATPRVASITMLNDLGWL